MAQGWNDARTRAIVQRATERRVQQLADTGLVDYRASAHGYLTFLAQLGEGFTEPPRVVKADQLALEVYWRAPNLSKQRIIGRRDTLLLPTDIAYHRDHLGIVQNNFPDIIRLGDGDEVSDVPHPFSPAGLDAYDFALSDSVSLRLPDRTILLLELTVRPKDDRQPRVIGAAYVDRETADVVRMAFNFTRAAFLDRHLEDISIVLENSLIAGRFWLPARQEIEIRRRGAWLDYPARGIIRGRWEICCYEINVGLDPSLFRGPEIVQAPGAVLRTYEWSGQVLDSLPPDIRAVRPEEVRRVQEEARRLVRAEALARRRSLTIAASSASDFARVNRVEGLALGAGITRRHGRGLSVWLRGRYGLADEELKGAAGVGWQRADGFGVRLVAHRGHRDAGDIAETSLLRNSFAAQEFGTDYTDPYGVRGIDATLDLGEIGGLRWSLSAGVERHAPVDVNARPANGEFQPTIPAWSLAATTLTVEVSRPTTLFLLGTELRARAELRGLRYERPLADGTEDEAALARGFADVELERPLGAHRLVSRSTAGWVTGAPGRVPPQALVYLGGPVSAPGYGFHTMRGTVGVTQRLEWRAPVPFIAVPLGRFGRAPAAATLAPYVHASYVGSTTPADAEGSAREARDGGWYPSAGVGLLTIFELLRLDLARGIRDGRWSFSVDVSREFWRIL